MGAALEKTPSAAMDCASEAKLTQGRAMPLATFSSDIMK